MTAPLRTPIARDRALLLQRRLRTVAAVLGTAAVGSFTGVAALNHAGTAAAKTATSTSTSSASTSTSTSASLAAPTTAPTAAAATAAATVSGGSSG